MGLGVGGAHDNALVRLEPSTLQREGMFDSVVIDGDTDELLPRGIEIGREIGVRRGRWVGVDTVEPRADEARVLADGEEALGELIFLRGWVDGNKRTA